MTQPLPAPLGDSIVVLEPLEQSHAEALWDAASGDRATYGLTLVPASLEAMRAYVEAHLADQARGASLPFATRDARTGRVVGATRFMNIERWSWAPDNPMGRTDGMPDAVEIGSTWLAPSAQRTAINTHAKLLMLGRAFDEWRVRRVTLKTDARNARSRAAIERLGARFDGVLRAHMPAFDGGVRDTAFYSILLDEWPAVRERLAAQR
jgi:RimJ/RimL family protein N-acetyltransferase